MPFPLPEREARRADYPWQTGSLVLDLGLVNYCRGRMAYARAFEAAGVCHTPLRHAGRLGPLDNSRALVLDRLFWHVLVNRLILAMTCHSV